MEAKGQAFVTRLSSCIGYRLLLGSRQDLGPGSMLLWRAMSGERLRCELLGTTSASSCGNECLGPEGRGGAAPHHSDT